MAQTLSWLPAGGSERTDYVSSMDSCQFFLASEVFGGVKLVRGWVLPRRLTRRARRSCLAFSSGQFVAVTAVTRCKAVSGQQLATKNKNKGFPESPSKSQFEFSQGHHLETSGLQLVETTWWALVDDPISGAGRGHNGTREVIDECLLRLNFSSVKTAAGPG